MSVENIIKNVRNGDNVKANKDFESLMSDKVTAALDARKVEIASTLSQRNGLKEEE